MKKILIIILFSLFFCLDIHAEDIDFKIGDKVRYNSIEFNVIGIENDYLELLKIEPLKSSELRQYITDNNLSEYTDVSEEYLKTAFFASSRCSGWTSIECNSSYDTSIVKQLVDYWSSVYLNAQDLIVDSTGYKVRLITLDNLINDFAYERYVKNISTTNYFKSPNTPRYIYNSETWIKSNINDHNEKALVISPSGNIYEENIYNVKSIRPVLNIKKNKVELLSKRQVLKDEQKIKSKMECKTGDIINYDNMKFYVLRDSGIDNEYVTLIKATPLTVDEVSTYGTGYINKYTQESVSQVYNNKGFGGLAFYSSETCGYKNPKDPTDAGCKNNYDESDVKHVVDAWAKDTFSSIDLGKDEYGYSARIMNDDDLLNHLNYIRSNQEITTGGEYIKYTEYTPSFNLSGCWTMIGVEDYNRFVAVRSVDGYFYATDVYYYGGTVCPVVTVKKKDIIDIKDSDIVDVPDTNFNKVIIFMVFGALIVGISGIIIYYFTKKNK